MISGATYLLILDYGGDISAVDKVVFTMSGGNDVKKSYPTDVSYSNGKFLVPLKQEETLSLGTKNGHIVKIEAQINFANKSVEKYPLGQFFIEKTLGTEIVTGNSPSGNIVLAHLKFEYDGDVLIAKVEGDISPEEIEEAVEKYLDEHPVEAGISEEECETIVQAAIVNKADKSEIPSLNGYATESYVTNAISGKADKSEIPSLNGYATESYVTSAISGKADKTEIPTKVTDLTDASDYAKKSEITEIPSFTSAQNGKVLGVVNGALAWVDATTPQPQPTVKTLVSISASKTKTSYEVNDTLNVDDITVLASYSDSTSSTVSGWTTNASSIDMTTEGSKSLVVSYTEGGITKTDTIALTVTSVEPQPTPSRPDVPQTGTWQMKTTHKNGYILIGKDDDTSDQAMFVRMVSGYGFPVTINTTFNNAYDMVSHKQTSDADTDVSMYPSGSVSRFAEDTNVHSVNMAIIENNLGEVAQHGASTHSLWKSSEVTDEQLDTLYSTYTSGGGTRTKDEFFIELKRSNEDSDVDQGASYVSTNRASLEADLNYSIYTLGTWGTSEFFVVDGIQVCPRSDLSCGGSSDYARGWNYWGDGQVTMYSDRSGKSPWKVTRLSDGFQASKTANYLESIYQDNSCAELFGHKVLTGIGTVAEWTAFKNTLDTIKSYVDAGKIQVVTRYQYSQLGEFVSNPITALSVSRSGSLNIGDTDSDSAYTVTVTYSDGTSGQPNADMILDRSAVDTTQGGTYTVYAYYRGFKVSCSVNVMSASFTIPDGLKDYDNWFIYQNNTNGNWYAGNYSKTITQAMKSSSSSQLIIVASEKSGELNGWKSTDNGTTWTQVTTNRTTYNVNITTSKTSDTDGGYQFNSAYNDTITLVDSSGFAWNY